MDIIVKGRHTEVSDRFRRHVDTKLAKIERLDQKVIRVDVEVSEERNPRQADQRERVELTIRSRGPAIRAEAAADDRYGALDLALDKLESRLRRISDRRKAHGKVRIVEPIPEGEVAELNGSGAFTAPTQTALAEWEGDVNPELDDHLVPIAMEGDGPVVCREKFHKAEAMNIEQALFEMELVGHDFFLYRDTEHGTPSVVYRRRGWAYGVIRLIEE